MRSHTAKRFGLVAILIGLALCGVGLWLLVIPAKYQATTRIVIEHYEAVVEPGGYGSYFIQTEFEVIQSTLLLGRVIEALHLNAEWGGKYAGGKTLETYETLRLLRQRLSFHGIKNTKFIDISVTDANPVMAARIANSLAETFRGFRADEQQKLEKAKNETGKAMPAQSAKTPLVEIVEPAVPPKSAMGPDRLFGAVLLFCGLAALVAGFYLIATFDSLAGNIMRTAIFSFLATSFLCCTGCTTVRDFYGAATNLKGDGEQTPEGTHLRIALACSGTAADGRRYVAFSFRHQNCCLVVFHPPVASSGSLRTETASGQTSAWLVRGRKPDCAVLARGGAERAFFTGRVERLHGTVEIICWRSTDDFYMLVELVGETGETAVRGQLASYTALWRPLLGPAMLLGFGGARTSTIK